MRLRAVLVLVALGACSAPLGQGSRAPSPVETLPTGRDDTCDAQRYGTLVGADAGMLETVLILGPVRVNRPGAITAPTYLPARINFDVGEGGRIVSITCG